MPRRLDVVRYNQLVSLPIQRITWLDSNRDLVPLAGADSYEARFGLVDNPGRLIKTTNIVGLDIAPNYLITWEPTDLATIGPGYWFEEIYAMFGVDTRGGRCAQFIVEGAIDL